MPGGQMLGALVMAGVNANWLLTGSGPMLIEPYAYPQPPTKTAATVEGTAAMASTVKAARIDEDSYDSWAAGVNMANFVPVRYYSNVAISAGHGALNEGHVPDALLFRRAFLRHIGAHPRQLVLVRVRGDSMHPTLQNRWTVMIDTAKRT